MAEQDITESRPPSKLSRRQLIRRGMLVGGVALWSAPVVASAGWNRSDSRQDALDRINQQSDEQDDSDDDDVEPAPPTSCTGYPAGTCIDFVCLGAFTVCGEGPGGTDCFCDVDVDGNCVCRNDAECDELDTCAANADCPPGWFCIPSSCCGGARCAPPCGVTP